MIMGPDRAAPDWWSSGGSLPVGTMVRCPNGPIGRVACTHHCVHPLDMFKQHRTHPHPDIAGAFRDGVGRLERPERRQTEATRLRICLTRPRKGVLLDRLQHDSVSASRGV